MKRLPLTPAQRIALENLNTKMAQPDGWVITWGADPRIERSLLSKGLIEKAPDTPLEPYRFRLTDKGREALNH